MKLIFLLFVFTCIIYTINGQQTTFSTKQCMENGGYCQYHSDCCSKSCLSYSYRCVKNHQNIQSTYNKPSYGGFYQPESSGAGQDINSIDELVDRFGGTDNDGSKSTTNAIVPQPTPIIDSIANVPIALPSTTTVRSVTIVCSNEGQRCFNANDCCNGNNTCSIENTCIFDERILITGSCLKTGSKCFKHEDCCSKICHGFLHQCVS